MASSAGGTAADATLEEAKKEVKLAEYTPPTHLIDSVTLDCDLRAPDDARIRATQRVRVRDASNPASRLELDGSPDIELLELSVDGQPHSQHQRTPLNGLALDALPTDRPFELQTLVKINPKANLALEGLYISDGNFTTQMEAQGFRNTTFHLDRPDILSTWTVTVRAGKQSCPVLLSNGNLISSKDCGDGRHEATYEDPIPKPCYLFALVAGDLAETRDRFTRASGPDVDIRVFTEHADKHKVDWHIECLKNAMRWDEQVYGNEYDLDEYKTVCVNSFQAGAMENKGLVIFNSKRALATPETATDGEFSSVEGVVAHEYFHVRELQCSYPESSLIFSNASNALSFLPFCLFNNLLRPCRRGPVRRSM
jgi:aminopeptidase N